MFLNKIKKQLKQILFKKKLNRFSVEDEFFMKQAIIESHKAQKLEEVPVGCVIIKNQQIIAKGYNIKEKKHDITAHAEIIAIREASRIIRNWRLSDCTLYVTKEPCPMCMSAISQARIAKVVFGMPDKKYGFRALIKKEHYTQVQITEWLLQERITTDFQNFFHYLRKRNKQKKRAIANK